MSAGKLTQKTAEEIYKKSQSSKTSFIAEVTGSGAVSAADVVHTMATMFGAPLLDLAAFDPARLPKDLLDAKICQAYRVLPLSQRQQPPDRGDSEPHRPGSCRKDQVHHTNGCGLDHCRIRQARQARRSSLEECERIHGVADQWWRLPNSATSTSKSPRNQRGRNLGRRGRTSRQVLAQDAD